MFPPPAFGGGKSVGRGSCFAVAVVALFSNEAGPAPTAFAGFALEVDVPALVVLGGQGLLRVSAQAVALATRSVLAKVVVIREVTATVDYGVHDDPSFSYRQERLPPSQRVGQSPSSRSSFRSQQHEGTREEGAPRPLCPCATHVVESPYNLRPKGSTSLNFSDLKSLCNRFATRLC